MRGAKLKWGEVAMDTAAPRIDGEETQIFYTYESTGL
jgi:hypothetical protein